MHIRYFFVLLILFSFPVAADEKVGKYPELFKSGSYDVTVLPIGDDDALIEVTGINDEALDGKIFRHTKKCHNTRCSDYIWATADLPGKENWWTLEVKDNGNWETRSLIYPGMGKREPAYQKERNPDFDSRSFYQRYLGQNVSTAASGK